MTTFLQLGVHPVRGLKLFGFLAQSFSLKIPDVKNKKETLPLVLFFLTNAYITYGVTKNKGIFSISYFAND